MLGDRALPALKIAYDGFYGPWMERQPSSMEG